MNIKEIVSSAGKLPYRELCTALIDCFAVRQPVKWDSVLPYAEQHSLFGGEILRLISDHPTLANQKEIRPVCLMKGELSQLLFFYIQLKDEKLSRTVIERISKKFVGGAAADRYIIWFFGNNNADALKIVISGKEGKKIRLKTLTLEAGHWFKTYDYILGEVERRFTPASIPPLSSPPLARGGDRGGDLKEPSGLYKAIWEAFDISIVNKRFYAEIKGVFDALTKEELPKCKGILTDEKERVQFAIRLIGRIIFCWFLKRKDIIAADVLSSKAVQSTPNYYRSLLEPLFFDVFNTPHTERRKELPVLIMNYPFLNGGLFEPQRQDCKDNWSLYIPNDWFEGFFSNTLEKYNFTVDENTAASAEIAIDPEMLGRIFENLLAEQNPETGESARKATGSYYTPREIVDFMVEESLIAYLKGKTDCHSRENGNPENMKIIPSPLAGEGKGEGGFYNAVEDFVHTAELSDALKPHSKELLENLNTVKVLDPACGSGAFPISMLQKLVALKQQLSPDVGDNKLYDIKLKTIENSIYGVDIQPMATELSRLRCWLSLIVDEDPKDIKPLPNLDFKFVTANSLIDLGYDDFIQKVETGKIGGLFLADFINKLNELRLIRQKYFYTVANAKENNQRIPSLEKGGKVYIPSPLTGEGEGGGELCGSSSKDKLKKEFNTIKSDLFDMSMKLINQGFTDLEFANKINKWNPFDDSEAAPFFNKEWMFGVVDGFDVVIGNPPYALLQNISVDPGYAKQLKMHYVAAQYKIDLYHLFIEAGINLLCSHGVLSYITPNAFLKNTHTNRLRGIMLNTKILMVLLFYCRVFEDPSVDNLVFILQKPVSAEEAAANQIIVRDIREGDFTEQLQRNRLFPQYNIRPPEFIFELDITFETAHILAKIENETVPFGTIGGTYFGIQTFDRKTFVSSEKRNRFFRPVIDGSNVSRYVTMSPIEFVDFQPQNIKSGGDEDIYYKDRIVVRQIGRYPEGAICPDGVLTLNTIYNLYLNDRSFDLRYVLAIINSRVLQFYWLQRFYDNKDTFPKIKKQPLHSMPIKLCSGQTQRELSDLVERIVAVKQKDPTADTAALERQIDEMVYKLYDLTPEEIAIVEGQI